MSGYAALTRPTRLSFPATKTIAGECLKQYAACKSRFKNLVELIDPSTVPAKAGAAYKLWKNSTNPAVHKDAVR